MRLIDKGEGRRDWSLDKFKPLEVGAEGEKGYSAFELKERVVGDLFIKRVESVAEAEDQKKKWESLKKRGIHVSPIFRIAQDESGGIWIVAKDLTDGDKKWVVSENNSEVMGDPEYWRVVTQMTDEKKKKIVREIFDIAIKAGKRDESGESLSFSEPNQKTYPFMVEVDKEDPNSAEIVIADLGIDVTTSTRDSEDIIRGNVREALYFLSGVLGIFSHIPEDHPAYKYKDILSEGEWKSFVNQKKHFDLYLKMLGV